MPTSENPKGLEDRLTRLVAVTIFAWAAGTMVAVVVYFSLLPAMREHLRVKYGLENPSYYDALPADTEANRQAALNLLTENDKLKAEDDEFNKRSSIEAEDAHGRTSGENLVCFDCKFEQRPNRLRDGYTSLGQACHLRNGWGDGWLDLCRSVDESVQAAAHYEDDVESYWTSKLRPTDLFGRPLNPTSSQLNGHSGLIERAGGRQP